MEFLVKVFSTHLRKVGQDGLLVEVAVLHYQLLPTTTVNRLMNVKCLSKTVSIILTVTKMDRDQPTFSFLQAVMVYMAVSMQPLGHSTITRKLLKRMNQLIASTPDST